MQTESGSAASRRRLRQADSACRHYQDIDEAISDASPRTDVPSRNLSIYLLPSARNRLAVRRCALSTTSVRIYSTAPTKRPARDVIAARYLLYVLPTRPGGEVDWKLKYVAYLYFFKSNFTYFWSDERYGTYVCMYVCMYSVLFHVDGGL